MGVLTDLVTALRAGAVTVIDLTAPLGEDTPVIALPPDHGQPWAFRREQISRYDAAGPEVYWNNVALSEHTGTHFDAPVHWLSGRDLDDVSQVPVARLVGPAAVLDFSAQAAASPDFLLTREHVERWQDRHGPLPPGGWLLYRTGWDSRRDDADAVPQRRAQPRRRGRLRALAGRADRDRRDRHRDGGHRRGPGLARWASRTSRVTGTFRAPGKYGLTQFQNLSMLPPQGAVLIAAPLPIVGGSGSPARILALVER